MRLAEHCACILSNDGELLEPCWAHLQEYPDCAIPQSVKKGGVGRVSLGAQGKVPQHSTMVALREDGP